MVVENLFSDLSIWVNRPKFLVLEVIYSVQMRYLGWLPDQIIGPDFQSLVKLWYWNEIAAKVLESFSCLNTGCPNLNWHSKFVNISILTLNDFGPVQAMKTHKMTNFKIKKKFFNC